MAELEKEMYDTDSATSEDSTPNPDQKPARNAKNNMTISLDGLKSSIDPSQMFTRAYGNMKAHQAAIAQVHAINGGSAGYSSAPPTAHSQCPTCGKSTSDPLILYNALSSDDGPLSSSPLVVPMGPLAAAAFESGMSAVEELKLLKAQVQDVARVCNAVARGDLSQKITVPVQGVVMVQLKDVINTMVCSPVFFFSIYDVDLQSQRSTNSDNSLKRLLVYLRKSERKGEFSPLFPTLRYCLVIILTFELHFVGSLWVSGFG